MANFIFRRIGGRVVRIDVEKTVKVSARGGKDVAYKLRSGFQRIGEFWAQQSSKRPHRFIAGSHINKEYRGYGLGKEFYGKLGKAVRREGGKTLVGSTDNVSIIGRVRKEAGKTRGFAGKGAYSGTTFVTLLKGRKKK